VNDLAEDEDVEADIFSMIEGRCSKQRLVSECECGYIDLGSDAC